MTIAQIKYFVTIAKCLSITKASEQLFISQPALSRHLRNMEEELNLQLFVRTTNGIRLTPAGSYMLMVFDDLYNNYNQIVKKAQEIQRGIMGNLNVGVLDHECISDFMPQVYHYFKDKHPNVELKLEVGSFSYLLSSLYSGKLDMIITLQFEVVNKESIIYQYITHSKDHIMMSTHHPLASKEHVTLDDLKDETFVMISKEDNPESSELIINLCREHGFTPQVHYAKTLSEQILWIASGMGVSILDSRNDMVHNPNIKTYEMESNWDPSLVIAWNQHNFNPLISEFVNKMNQILGLDGEDLHGDAFNN